MRVCDIYRSTRRNRNKLPYQTLNSFPRDSVRSKLRRSKPSRFCLASGIRHVKAAPVSGVSFMRCCTPSIAWRTDGRTGGEQLCSGKYLFGGTPSLPFPSLPSPPLSLEVGPLFEARGSGERSSSPSGSWQSAKRILLHFELKSRHLVTTILVIFLTINWSILRFFGGFNIKI